MPNPVHLTMALLAGVALSAAMFGGLWWTLRRLPTTRRPGLTALASFWIRLAVTALGFYLIAAGDWRRGLAALLGFIIGRTVLLRLIGPSPPSVASRGA